MQTNVLQQPAEQARDAWFDNLLARLEADKFMLETHTATPETTCLYDDLISGNMEALVRQSHEVARQHFITNMLLDYLKTIREKDIRPRSLAFDLNDHEVLVWAVIPEEDEAIRAPPDYGRGTGECPLSRKRF